MKKIIMIILIFFIIKTTAYAMPEISAGYACLIEATTGQIIYEYNAYEKHPMASTTKIMTAIVALENSTVDDIVTVSSNAAKQEGSSAYLGAGSNIPMRDLLYGLMLNSGNDAAVAIAEHICGSTNAFADLMNQKAIEIGAKNTNFENPNGLDSENHYTTAADLAKITAYAMKIEKFKEIVSSKIWKTDYSAGTIYFSNHNKLLENYEGCIGVKTGFTKKTGRCLVSAAKRGDITLICVTLAAPNDWNDHKLLLDYGFENVELKKIFKKNQVMKTLKCNGGFVLEAITEKEYFVPDVKHKHSNIEIILHTVPSIRYSVDKGEKLGYCSILSDGVEIGRVDLISGEKYIKHITLLEKIRSHIFKN